MTEVEDLGLVIEPQQKLYLNPFTSSNSHLFTCIEPQQKLYLNEAMQIQVTPEVAIEPQQKLYLNFSSLFSRR